MSQRLSKQLFVRACTPVVIAVALGMLAAGGCGRGSDLPLSPVRGLVTHQGEPLSHGEVVFTPIEGTTGPQAIGHIQSDGTFRMQTANQPGAVVGRHRVTVHCREERTEEQRRDMEFIPKSLIPERYSRPKTSPLEAEVQEGRNEIPMDLE